VLIAIAPAIHSTLRNFRMTFLRNVAAVISVTFIVVAENDVFIVGGMALLGVYLIWHYLRRFRVAFTPSTIFADVGGGFRKVWKVVKESEHTKPPKDQKHPQYQKKYGDTLLSTYVATTLLYLIGERLQRVVNSRMLDLYFLGSLVYTFVLTVFVFAVEYFGVQRVWPGGFEGVADPGFVDFLAYSFSTLMMSEIALLRAMSEPALIVANFELVGSLALLVLLASVGITVARERYKEDFGSIVEQIRKASEGRGSLLEANFALTPSAAEKWLIAANPKLIAWVLALRHGKELAQKTIAAAADTSTPSETSAPAEPQSEPTEVAKAAAEGTVIEVPASVVPTANGGTTESKTKPPAQA
jgi:hypothetical protein